MASGEIHVGDVGIAFRLQARDEGDRVVDVSGASLRRMLFQRPDGGGTLTKAASLTNDGTDGLFQYVSASGDLDVPGGWKYQGYLEMSGGSWHTDVHKFKVLPNLD